ncbi:MAG: replicative DNA helicase [Gemmatimonadetes bacterium]|nr:replicative DNA helicase [Gemmatimonadota bacterium]
MGANERLLTATNESAEPRSSGYDREPPYSLEAEISVLGGMLIDREAVARAVDFIDDSMFHREAHRRLFRAMVRLFQRDEAIDVITLSEELKKTGEFDSVGGMRYLAELLDAVPTAANLEYHARLVRDKATLRRLIDASHQIVRDVHEPGERTVDEVVDLAEQRVFHVARARARADFVRIKEVLWPTFEYIEARQQSPSKLTGVATGFPDLDRLTAGFQRGDLIIIAGRPSMGKTSLALNIAQNAALEPPGVPVAIFSLEMSKEQLVQRLLCAEARVNFQNLRRGILDTDELQSLAKAAAHLNTAPIWIDDTPGTTILETRGKARRLKAHAEVGLIVVDYLQLMTAPTRGENRVQEVSEISRGLKTLAKELEVPVVALSQLSRAPEQRGADRRPQLSDLRESGALEQDADVVMFLYREEYYRGALDEEGNVRIGRDGLPIEGKTELIIAKQRNGPTDKIPLYFNKAYARFDSMTRGEPE